MALLSAKIETKSELVKRHLLNRLFSRDLMPGDMINRHQVAEALGVSVAPVQEALIQLESAGYLEVSQRKYTRVKVCRPDDLYGQLLVREALECLVASLLAEDPAALDIDTLRELAGAADSSFDEWPRHGRDEAAFHGALAEATECPVLIRHLRNVIETSLFFTLYLSIPSPDRGVDKSHALLLDRIVGGDVDTAAQAVRDHLCNEREFLRRLAASSATDDGPQGRVSGPRTRRHQKVASDG